MQLHRARLQHNFGEAAIHYDALAEFQHVQTRRVLDSALMLLPCRAALVDIGCGTGYFAKAAMPHRPDWQVIGVDISHGMCRVANTRCQAVNADAARLPLADASIDGAVSALCYQWVENQPVAFAELARVLKPHARAIIASLGQSTLHELRACAAKVELPLSQLAMPTFLATKAVLEAANFIVTMHEKREEVQYYPSVAALLHSMRAIGAGNNFSPTMRGMTGPKRWAAMVHGYEALRMPQGIPATWEHHFFIVSKSS